MQAIETVQMDSQGGWIAQKNAIQAQMQMQLIFCLVTHITSLPNKDNVPKNLKDHQISHFRTFT